MNNNTLNVLQLVNSLDIGGLEKVVIYLVNNNHNDKVKLSIACLEKKGSMASFVNPGTDIFELDKNNSVYISLIFRLLKIVKKNKIHILHCHNYAPLFFGIIIKTLLFGKLKIVFTEHNQVYSISEKHYKIFKRLLKKVDKIVCVSKALMDYFEKNQLGSSQVIWNGIPFPSVEEDKAKALNNEFHKNVNDFLVGTAVVMSEQKGLAYLIEASKKIIADYPHIKFLMIGDGPLKNDLEKMVDDYNLKENYYFVGYRKDVANYLKILNLFVLPSLWEGFSIVLLEANALGLPIICTDVGGNKEIIQNGHNGFLVPARDVKALEDSIEKLYAQNELRLKMQTTAARYFQEKFTVETMVDKYNKIFLSFN